MHRIDQPIPLPKGTTVKRDDTAYRAIAILNLVIDAKGDLESGSVLVFNKYGETLTISLGDVAFIS